MLAAGIALNGCASGKTEMAAPMIIPQPAEMQLGEGVFRIGPNTVILADDAGDIANHPAAYLAAFLRKGTGFPLPVKTKAVVSRGNVIRLTSEGADATLGDEGYELIIERGSAVIRAPKPAGLFYGVQTLRQLLPAEAERGGPAARSDWSVPCLKIRDCPRFRWRGMLLDVSRHFFAMDTLKQTIDLLSLHKLNVLHLHLSDDQGWRVEIARYPELTRVASSGSYSDPNAGGGYLSKADVRELVAYAAERHIMIVPEIEMPGHAGAATKAYPEFSGGASTFNPGKEETYVFLEGILTEVMEMFPSPYIHFGGDEVNRSGWENLPEVKRKMEAEGLSNTHQLEGYFAKRIAAFIRSKGRTPMGWDEIEAAGVGAGAVIHWWRPDGTDLRDRALRSGRDVVLSPTSRCYFDYRQAASEKGFGGQVLALDTVYAWEPVEGLSRDEAAHVLGVQANVWTEVIPNRERLQYMMFPRLCALAEVAWTPPARKDSAQFHKRLDAMLERLRNLGINFRDPHQDPGQPK
jgi:hexosaminidase